MKPKRLSRGLRMCGAAICFVLISSLAGATTRWSSWIVGGARSVLEQGVITETAKMNVNLTAQGSQSYFPFALNKTYHTVIDSSTLTITSRDSALDVLQFVVSQQPFFNVSATGQIQGFLSTSSTADYKTKQLHTFVETQSQLICPNETFTSDDAWNNPFVGTQASVYVVYCPEGGFPIYAEAQFWHGVSG